jgi:glycosyltransferase involved in cell wall biosynthesis
MITGITRVRNESLIIEDTMKHFLKYCDNIIVYDDKSEDQTPDICAGFKNVTVIRGKEWSLNRQWEETRHRALLLSHVKTDWVLCFDADERLFGDLPDLTHDGYRFKLFDGYMTEDLKMEYLQGSLENLPRMWGPERRDILMLFRKDKSRYVGLDQREPVVQGHVETTQTFVKHFGKCLSVDHWEETCDYYSTYFPEPYKSKWEARKGKAIHTKSDFGRELYTWDEVICKF